MGSLSEKSNVAPYGWDDFEDDDGVTETQGKSHDASLFQSVQKLMGLYAQSEAKFRVDTYPNGQAYVG